MNETLRVTSAWYQGTERRWSGPADRPWYHFVNVRSHEMLNTTLHADTALLAAVVCESKPHPPGGTISTDNRFTRVQVHGYGRTKYGFAHAEYRDGAIVYPSYDVNNEHHVYDQCVVYNTTVAAWSNYGHQAKEMSWRDCKAGTDYGGSGLQMWGGSGIWQGGAMYGFRVCFELGSPSDPFTVIGGGYESFKQLLVAAGPRAESYAVTLQGLRAMTDGCDPTGGMPMIVFAGPGPLNIIGGAYGDGGQPLPVIEMRTWQRAPAVLNLIGVSFKSFGSWERRSEIVRYKGDGKLTVNAINCGYADSHGRMWTA